MTLTTAEAAVRLRKTPWFVRKILNTGELVGSRYGGEWHITEEALSAYVSAHMNVAPPKPGRRRKRR